MHIAYKREAEAMPEQDEVKKPLSRKEHIRRWAAALENKWRAHDRQEAIRNNMDRIIRLKKPVPPNL